MAVNTDFVIWPQVWYMFMRQFLLLIFTGYKHVCSPASLWRTFLIFQVNNNSWKWFPATNRCKNSVHKDNEINHNETIGRTVITEVIKIHSVLRAVHLQSLVIVREYGSERLILGLNINCRNVVLPAWDVMKKWTTAARYLILTGESVLLLRFYLFFYLTNNLKNISNQLNLCICVFSNLPKNLLCLDVYFGGYEPYRVICTLRRKKASFVILKGFFVCYKNKP